MAVEQLLLTWFRHFDRCHFTFDSKENLIIGCNGSGKTSLLEAIYYLAYAKSFRCSSTRLMIGHQHDRFQIEAKIVSDVCTRHAKSMHAVDKRLSGISLDDDKKTKQSSIARILPVVFIDASTHRDFANTPKNRRDFINWCCFYGDSEYHQYLLRFQRALQQRNQLLKQCRHHTNARVQLQSWSEPLVFYAEKVHTSRAQLMTSLNEKLALIWPQFFSMSHGSMTYDRGWRDSVAYGDCLQQSLEQDIIYGFTQYGPHRADLRCLTDAGHSVFQCFSHGQQKLFAYMTRFIQLALLDKTMSPHSVILIDDLAAELDAPNQSRVLAYLDDLPSQKFLTALSHDVFASNARQRAIYVDRIPRTQTENTLFVTSQNLSA